MVSLKLSQGAKPGIGGVLPGAKVTQEIAEARGVPKGEKCVSPGGPPAFLDSARARAVRRSDARAVWRQAGRFQALHGLALGLPGHLQGDGGRGSGSRLRDRRRRRGRHRRRAAGVRGPRRDSTDRGPAVGAQRARWAWACATRSGSAPARKVATGIDIVKRLVQGADYTNSARSMMMAVGCIQAQLCHTNTCPVGVATQDPRRARALDVRRQDRPGLPLPEGRAWSRRMQVMASMGVRGPATLAPAHAAPPRRPRPGAQLRRDVPPPRARASCLPQPPAGHWERDWALADPDRFNP